MLCRIGFSPDVFFVRTATKLFVLMARFKRHCSRDFCAGQELRYLVLGWRKSEFCAIIKGHFDGTYTE